MKELLTWCWDHDPEKRPSFEDLFSILSNDYTNVYFDDDIDASVINKYVSDLKNDQIMNYRLKHIDYLYKKIKNFCENDGEKHNWNQMNFVIHKKK